MLLMPLNIDEALFARACLSGMAGLKLIHGRTVDAADLIAEAGNCTDWRDGFHPDFLAAIRSGNIRLDVRWSRGPDEDLVKYAEASEDVAVEEKPMGISSAEDVRPPSPVTEEVSDSGPLPKKMDENDYPF